MKIKGNRKIVQVIFTCILVIAICFALPINSEVYSKERVMNVEKTLAVSKTTDETFYRVIVGSFKDITNAKNMVVNMESLGLDAFISEEVVNGQTLNRVIIGSFKERENADSMVKNIKSMGYDAFVDTFIKYSPESTPNTDSSSNEITYYAVIAGSFSKIENANERLKELKNDGFDCYISTDLIEGKVYNRIITGSFTNKQNAQNRVNELVKKGYEAFIDIYEENNGIVASEQDETTYYAVIVGSFKDSENAQNRVSELNKKGIDSYVSPININGEVLNRVIAGSFINKENANKMITTLKSYGYEAFIDVYVQ